jgi:magnesium transporter
LEEEATEDIYQTSGIDVTATEVGDNLAANVPGAFRARIPWLIVTLLIESGSAMVITHFDEVIKQTVIAASFMPLLTSLTGSVAMQSTCITIRESSTRPTLKTALKRIFHEMQVGAMLGVSCGVLTYSLSFLFKEQAHVLGLVVGVSLLITMSLGVIVGTIIPLFFERVGIEPAHASGPLITSLLDVSTMTIYLSIVHAFLTHIL